jgi:ribose-phosphate pyrophosphokinase
MSKILLVTTGGANEVASRLLAKSGIAQGKVFTELFPDGEVFHRLDTPVANAEAVVVGVGSFREPDALMEFYDVANLLADEGALGLTLLMPEDTGKSKQARFLKRVRERLLAGVPVTPLGNRVVEVDPACPSMPFYKTTTRRTRAKTLAGGAAAIDLFGARGKAVLFSTKSYGYMQEQFHALAEFDRGAALRDDDGIVKGLSMSVQGRDVVIIGGTIDHAETFDLYVMANACYEAGALSLTLVVPYFGYSTMERGKPDAHEAVKASYRARLISSIPRCPMGNRVVLCDLHSEGVPYYFGSGVRATHLYCIKNIIMEMVAGQFGGRLCTTDAGRAKWAESLVKDINKRIELSGGNAEQFWRTALAIKDRVSGSDTELLGILGYVAGMDIFLFDDMIRRGTTAIKAGEGYRLGKLPTPENIPAELRDLVAALFKQLEETLKGVDLGCKGIRFVASHGVLPGTSLKRLQDAKDHKGTALFSEVIVTDSHPNAVKLAGEFLKVKPIAPMLVAHVIQSLAIGN